MVHIWVSICVSLQNYEEKLWLNLELFWHNIVKVPSLFHSRGSVSSHKFHSRNTRFWSSNTSPSFYQCSDLKSDISRIKGLVASLGIPLWALMVMVLPFLRSKVPLSPRNLFLFPAAVWKCHSSWQHPKTASRPSPPSAPQAEPIYSFNESSDDSTFISSIAGILWTRASFPVSPATLDTQSQLSQHHIWGVSTSEGLFHSKFTIFFYFHFAVT